MSFTFKRPSFTRNKQIKVIKPKEKLYPELVPSTSWFTNLRSQLPKTEWDIIRKQVYQDAGMKCEICSGRGQKHPVECHEVFKYDETNGIQKLVRLIALCPACHSVKHIGLAQVRGRYEEALKHLSEVNNITIDEARELADNAFKDWERRSGMDWELDLSALKDLVKELDIRSTNHGDKFL